MNSRRALGEVFDLIAKKIKHADKIKVLQEHASQPLFYLLRLAYNEIPWDVPVGAPPYKPYKGRKGSEASDLMRECKRMYMFLGHIEPNMPQLRREKFFQDVLESVSEAEAIVLIAVKDKTLEKDYRLPRKVVEQAFPGLLDPPFDLKFGHKPLIPQPVLAGPKNAEFDWRHVV
jgi:hypothetical protein